MKNLVEATNYVCRQIIVTGIKLPKMIGGEENANGVSIIMARDCATNQPIKKGISISWNRAKSFNLTKIAINPQDYEGANDDVVVDLSGKNDKLLLNVTMLEIPENGAYRDKQSGELVPYRVTNTYQIVMAEEVEEDKADKAKAMFRKVYGEDYNAQTEGHPAKLLQIMAIV